MFIENDPFIHIFDSTCMRYTWFARFSKLNYVMWKTVVTYAWYAEVRINTLPLFIPDLHFFAYHSQFTVL